MLTAIERIQQWYADQCNGDWEHQYGVKIETLDNPGWRVDLELRDTSLVVKPFEQLEPERSENDWLHCFVKDGVFRGGGSRNAQENVLREIGPPRR